MIDYEGGQMTVQPQGALTCPDCGGIVSRTSPTCSHCGALATFRPAGTGHPVGWRVGWTPVEEGADFTGADLTNADFGDADLTSAVFLNARIDGAFLDGANLCGANLSGASLCGASLVGADLAGADLTGADLSLADLFGANLAEASLIDASVSGADLRKAILNLTDLTSADLSGAHMSDTSLCHADLIRADLAFADLTRADLTDANLTVARLDRSNLTDANLGSRAIADFPEAVFDKSTQNEAASEDATVAISGPTSGIESGSDEIEVYGGPDRDDENVTPDDLDFGDWIEIMQFPEQFPDLIGEVPDWVLDRLDTFAAASPKGPEDDGEAVGGSPKTGDGGQERESNRALWSVIVAPRMMEFITAYDEYLATQDDALLQDLMDIAIPHTLDALEVREEFLSYMVSRHEGTLILAEGMRPLDIKEYIREHLSQGEMVEQGAFFGDMAELHPDEYGWLEVHDPKPQHECQWRDEIEEDPFFWGGMDFTDEGRSVALYRSPTDEDVILCSACDAQVKVIECVPIDFVRDRNSQTEPFKIYLVAGGYIVGQHVIRHQLESDGF